MSMSDKQGKNQPTSQETPPTMQERSAIGDAKARLRDRSARFKVKIDAGKKGDVQRIGPPHADHQGWIDRLQDLFGGCGTDFATAELNRIINASRLKDDVPDNVRVNSYLAVIDGVRPANEIEAMVASQLAITHNLAMELLRRAQRAEQLSQFEAAGHMAAKLLRAFAGHAELLHKLRRGGEQTVRVEHVTVNAGGQAIVGSVTTGGRAAEKLENQPHAPQIGPEGQPRSLTAQYGPPMPRSNPLGEPMPVTPGEGTPPLPDARRSGG